MRERENRTVKPGLFRSIMNAAIDDRGLLGVVENLRERFTRVEIEAALDRAETSERVRKGQVR